MLLSTEFLDRLFVQSPFMKKKFQFQHKNLLRYLANTGIALLIFWTFFFIHRTGVSDFEAADIFRLLYNALMVNVVLEGTRRIAKRLSRKYDWREFGLRRFIYEWIAVQIYILLVMVLFEITPRLFLGQLAYDFQNPSAMRDLKEVFVFGSIILLFVHFIRSGIYFYNQWHRYLMQSEKLKKETIRVQFESLKQQVNPHFLFNSLNALSSLIYKDQDLAGKFVEQLSKVYRYVLENKDKELVTLHTELDFIESYLFLLKIRFRENLRVNMDIPEHLLKYQVAPLTMQLLMENAIKHNIVSRDEPLFIDVFIEGDYIIIKNNLQLRETREESTGVGLKNIINRYKFITDKKVDVEVTAHDFIAKLPLLNNAA
ncbi:sensor histidine kinase [Rufibacter tibetensis]|uniref:sensor histidine kinase n=1 Tax=Rufibacter tibetensis TaxID=512763 RepID=UPI000782113A|nr:histidine kinase [Rufibacter tibetensis]